VAVSARGVSFGGDATFTTLALPPLTLNLQLEQIKRNARAELTFSNQPGAHFTVLGTTNISLPLSEWTVLGSAIETSPGKFEFIDTGVTNRPQNFYRVRSP
jgi:hypothetical protein